MITVIALLFFVTAGLSDAAKGREWVALADCRYVTAKDNDGDSFRVRRGTKGFVLRLYFVDAPETDLRHPDRTREQSQYFGVTLDETVRAGIQARETVRQMLQGSFIVRTRWAIAARRGSEPRHYGLVEVEAKKLMEELVSRGLARTKGVSPNLPSGEKAKAYVATLEALERAARQKRIGVWATSTKK